MKRTILWAVVGAAFSFAASGCVVETTHGPGPGPVAGLADLEVSWNVSGSQDPSLCDYYGVRQWSVDAVGPESRGVDLDCHAGWHTGDGLHNLLEGTYTVTLSGFDLGGVQFYSRSVNVTLLDNGLVTDVDFTLTPADM